MKEKDAYQQLDDLLRAKAYGQLSETERALVASLGYEEEEYTFLRRSKKVMSVPPSRAEGVLPETLRRAVQSRQRPSILAYRLPAWQVAAGILFWLVVQGIWPARSEAPATVPVFICQTDTLLVKQVIRDTVRLFLPAPEPRIDPKAYSPAIAFDSLRRDDPASLDSVRGITVKDQPEFKTFFTETF